MARQPWTMSELYAAPPTIRDLRVRAVEIPLEQSIETAGGTIRTSPLVLLDLLTQEGITGSAYLFCYTPLVLAPLAGLLLNLRDVLHGTAAASLQVARILEGQFRLLGSVGLVAMAAAAVDMALWDILAKAQGLPLSTLLGGETETVPAYAGIRSMEPREAAREATAAVAGGFTAVKVKLGRGSLEDDLEVIRTVREAVGDEVALMVDYNQSLTVAEALHRGRALEGEGLTWIEEPVEADDYTGHASVARELHTPIQLGENWWGPKDMAQSIAANGSDYATFDAVRIGGVTGWLRAAALAEVAGLPVSSHRFPEVSASLLAATPVAHWLEFVDTVSPVLAHPLHVEGGRARVPSEPGLGLAWDEDAVARYLVE